MNSRRFKLLGVSLLIALLALAVAAVDPSPVESLLAASAEYARTFLAVLLVVGMAAGFISYYEYHGFGTQDGIVRRGPAEPVVSITFDDGPNPEYTPQLLDALKEKGVKASFFCVGMHVEKYPEVARRIVNEGHDIGNHTYSHKDMVPATRRVIESQVRRTDAAIRTTTGIATRLFRPPRGLYSGTVRRIVVDEFGHQLVLWTVSALDWRRLTPRQIVRRVARYVRPGAIILFHDSGALLRREGGKRTSTVEALPLVIDYLKGAGYEVLSISEMLERFPSQESATDRVLERA